MTSLCFGRYGREDNTLIMTTLGKGVRPGEGFRGGSLRDRPDPGKEEVHVNTGGPGFGKQGLPTDTIPSGAGPSLGTAH